MREEIRLGTWGPDDAPTALRCAKAKCKYVLCFWVGLILCTSLALTELAWRTIFECIILVVVTVFYIPSNERLRSYMIISKCRFQKASVSIGPRVCAGGSATISSITWLQAGTETYASNKVSGLALSPVMVAWKGVRRAAKQADGSLRERHAVRAPSLSRVVLIFWRSLRPQARKMSGRRC